MPATSSLSRLGITNVEEIKKVTVQHTATADVVIVHYKRPIFDFKNRKKKITFDRPSRQIFVNKYGRSEWKGFSCPSPQFQQVLNELHSAANNQAVA